MVFVFRSLPYLEDPLPEPAPVLPSYNIADPVVEDRSGATTYSAYNPSPVLPAHEGAPAEPITYGPVPLHQYGPSHNQALPPFNLTPFNHIPTFPFAPHPFFPHPFLGSPFGYLPYHRFGLPLFPFHGGFPYLGYQGTNTDGEGTDIEYPGPVYSPGSQNIEYAARSAPLPPPQVLAPAPAPKYQPTEPTR